MATDTVMQNDPNDAFAKIMKDCNPYDASCKGNC